MMTHMSRIMIVMVSVPGESITVTVTASGPKPDS